MERKMQSQGNTSNQLSFSFPPVPVHHNIYCLSWIWRPTRPLWLTLFWFTIKLCSSGEFVQRWLPQGKQHFHSYSDGLIVGRRRKRSRRVQNAYESAPGCDPSLLPAYGGAVSERNRQKHNALLNIRDLFLCLLRSLCLVLNMVASLYLSSV